MCFFQYLHGSMAVLVLLGRIEKTTADAYIEKFEELSNNVVNEVHHDTLYRIHLTVMQTVAVKAGMLHPDKLDDLFACELANPQQWLVDVYR